MVTATTPSDSTDLAWDCYSQLETQQGFVSGGVYDDGDLELYWLGEPSETATNIINVAESAGVSVTLESATNDPDQFWSDAVALVAALEDAGITVYGFGSNRIYSTMELVGPPDESDQNVAEDLASSMFGDRYDLVFLSHGHDVGY